jgi:hypothetical protein
VPQLPDPDIQVNTLNNYFFTTVPLAAPDEKTD